MLKMVKSSAIKARTQAINQIKAIIVTAPLELRHELVGLDVSRLVARCARFRPGHLATPVGSAKYSLRLLARRHGQLTSEIEGVNDELLRLTAETAPALVELLVSDLTRQPPSWSPQEAIQNDRGLRLRSLPCVV